MKATFCFSYGEFYIARLRWHKRSSFWTFKVHSIMIFGMYTNVLLSFDLRKKPEIKNKSIVSKIWVGMYTTVM